MNSHSIILDGEMLVWDPVSERTLPFGTLKTAALGMFSLTGRDTGIYCSQINPRKT
jgi:ATP-dependent DNA ligase